ncbi:class A beta-lactamase [Roseomonas pecuniae]|uniref:Beta-lactamase n=2 Tax=Roseomonas populi TaxID=3121582 RepID=A0ABT1X8X0_9PROT|nr:class A beta-lactamase [Roseomonas pecuniae]
MAGRRGLLGLVLGATAAVPARAGETFGGIPFAAAIRAAEAMGGGRLGVSVLDTGSGRRCAWRGGQRFPVTSTFKMLLAAAILAEADAGRERLDRHIRITPADILEYAPVTGRHVSQEGMSLGELCEAAVVWSDNTAGNLLLSILGGPAGLTGFVRRLEDEAFRLDRTEPTLNEASPGDPRDTTTPDAMLGTMQRLLLGPALSPESRARLTEWLLGCRTGDEKIRAGLPAGWRCGDKTGGGGHGTNNDVAILWPPGRAPILVTAYLTESAAPLAARNAALAAVGRAVAAA